MADHTPGPWRIGFDRHEVEDSKGRPLLRTRATGEPGAPVANATLCAAAPDLLAALEDLCRVADHALSGRGNDMPSRRVLAQVADARAAIRVARGEK